ncbi:MAG TPA: hypothetical protein DD979_12425 [Gammaproteobacteria bacterium]|jgi:outer membrane receptor for ferric coprogen and ferric-rhodotorulic acid|nr:hypothetical protein [Gammaproteobacteria bacterium]
MKHRHYPVNARSSIVASKKTFAHKDEGPLQKTVLALAVLAALVSVEHAVAQDGGVNTDEQSAVQELPDVPVSGEIIETSTEGTQSYKADAVTLGKEALRLRDIPHSVSVITHQRMKDQNMT